MVTPWGDDRPRAWKAAAWTFEGAYWFYVNPAGGDAPSGVWPDRMVVLRDAVQETFAARRGFTGVTATINGHQAIVAGELDADAAPTVRAAIDQFETTMHAAARSIAYPDDGEVVGISMTAARDGLRRGI